MSGEADATDWGSENVRREEGSSLGRGSKPWESLRCEGATAVPKRGRRGPQGRRHRHQGKGRTLRWLAVLSVDSTMTQ